MSILENILEYYPEDEILKADGFDDAILGYDELSGRLIYSVQKCLDILVEDMSYEDALEHFSFNISGAYVGEKTPIWCVDNF